MLFGKAERGQNHVGVLGRLGEEDILHNKKINHLERLSCSVEVWVGKCGILTHYVDCLYVAGLYGVEELDNSEPLVRRKFF